MSLDDSAAEMHCTAYSCGCKSEGMEILGRTSYFRLGTSRGLETDIGGGGADRAASSFKLSVSTGVVALLDGVEGREDNSELSDIADVDDPNEVLALSAIRESCGRTGVGFDIGVLLQPRQRYG